MMKWVLTIISIFLLSNTAFGIDKLKWIYFSTLDNSSNVYIAIDEMGSFRNDSLSKENVLINYYYKIEKGKEQNLISKVLKEKIYYTSVVGFLGVNCKNPSDIYIYKIKRFDQNGVLESDQKSPDINFPEVAPIKPGSIHYLITKELCRILDTASEIKTENKDVFGVNQQLFEQILEERSKPKNAESNQIF